MAASNVSAHAQSQSPAQKLISTKHL